MFPWGDPAGIGPEIVLKSLCKNNFSDQCHIAVIGDSWWLTRTAEQCGLEIQLQSFHRSALPTSPGIIHLIESPISNIRNIVPGIISATAGTAAFQFIKEATAVTRAQPMAAMTTTPINKESLRAANVPFIGHTEMLASLTESPEPLTLFQVKSLRVFFLTRHLSLKDACEAVTTEKVYSTTKQACQTLQQLGVERPHLAIAGLNPHCGEDGLFGEERAAGNQTSSS